MTAEKGEHERAPRAGESYPTPLRATLRAPPAKWAIRAFVPAGEQSEPRPRTARRAPAGRSPRRAAGRAASEVAVPPAFFGTFFRAERKYCPLGAAAPLPAPESARQAPSGIFYNQVSVYRRKQGAFRSPPAPLRTVVVDLIDFDKMIVTFLEATTQRGPHCRAPRLLFAKTFSLLIVIIKRFTRLHSPFRAETSAPPRQVKPPARTAAYRCERRLLKGAAFPFPPSL